MTDVVKQRMFDLIRDLAFEIEAMKADLAETVQDLRALNAHLRQGQRQIELARAKLNGTNTEAEF